uniref:Uncharacterized protein n=1 Tax=Anguilla anguilla TaxID=7936 RepID=A0A0E9UMD7_ANGAN
MVGAHPLLPWSDHKACGSRSTVFEPGSTVTLVGFRL